MQTSKHPTIPARDKQSGAVLLISLVMLLLLTIIGVGSVEDMTLQSNMTRNSQFKMQAYNTAYSEATGQYRQLSNDITILSEAQNSANAITFDTSKLFMPSASNPFDQTLLLLFQGSRGSPVAENEAEMMEFGEYEDMGFEFNSIARLPNTGTQSDQLQGISYTAPKQKETRTD